MESNHLDNKLHIFGLPIYIGFGIYLIQFYHSTGGATYPKQKIDARNLSHPKYRSTIYELEDFPPYITEAGEKVEAQAMVENFIKRRGRISLGISSGYFWSFVP